MKDKHRRAPKRRGNSISEKAYEFTLYPNEIDTCEINTFLVSGKHETISVLHDKDVDEEGVLKKPHYHYILIFEREKSLNALSKELGIAKERIEWIENLPKAIEYLWHKNNPEKYQYDKAIVQSTCDIDKYIDKDEKLSETDELKLIMAYISKYENGLSLFDIYCFCVDNNVWSTYRRNYSIIKDMLNEARRTHSSIGYFTVFLTEEERKARGITFETEAHYEMAKTNGA